MNEDIRNLISLQQIDIRISKLDLINVELTEEVARKESEITQIKDGLAAGEEKLKTCEVKVHDRKVDIEGLKETLKKYTEQRNYIKKPRELFAIDKEIETTLRSIRVAETELQKLEKELTDSKQERESEENKLKVKQEEADTIRQKNSESVGKNQADLETARSERREIIKSVPSDLLSTYDFISRNKQGIALAEVSGEACSGCYISLPPQLINEIRRGDKIIRCTSCARILYM